MACVRVPFSSSPPLSHTFFFSLVLLLFGLCSFTSCWFHLPRAKADEGEFNSDSCLPPGPAWLVAQDTTSQRSLWGKEGKSFLGTVQPLTIWQGKAVTEALGRLDHQDCGALGKSS